MDSSQRGNHFPEQMVIPKGESCTDPDLQSRLQPVCANHTRREQGMNTWNSLSSLPSSNLLLMLLLILPNRKPEGKGAY